MRKRKSGYKKKETKVTVDYLRYRFNYFYKRGEWDEAKKVSESANALFGRNLDQEFHAKIQDDPRDPFGIGKAKKIKYG